MWHYIMSSDIKVIYDDLAAWNHFFEVRNSWTYEIRVVRSNGNLEPNFYLPLTEKETG